VSAPHKPTLAYVVHSLDPGGTEKLVVEMSLAFAAEYRVVVFCLDEPGLWASRLRQNGIPVHCVWRQPGFDALVPGKLARLCRQYDVQLIHAHQCTPWFYAALSRLRYRRPKLLLEEHGRFYPEVDSPKRRAFNRLVTKRLTHRFVAVSNDVRERLVKYEGLDPARVEVVYNGVELDPPLTPDARTQLRAEFGFGPDDFVVGTVGRFDPIKNLPMLVDALAAARLANANVRGLLIGDGPERAVVEAGLEATGLTRDVRLTGFRDDARRLVQALDLFVLASYSEGTSMALLEAMGYGVPVAVTRVGGNPEVVTDGETGWIVKSGDVKGLTRAILEAAGDESLRRARASAGRRRYAERFAFDRMLDEYRLRYAELLGAKLQAVPA
jgi:glycosyltransferase involved in cell wall biosynthesis